ncbi:MAG: hypothetical protein O3A29_16140 [Planctomycetota bacterium]|nr:hypothetical protein [Planctomycetota bacterium]
MSWALAASLVALASAQAGDLQAPGIARIRSQAPLNTIQQTRFHDDAVADPGHQDTADKVDVVESEIVECDDACRGRRLRHGCGHCGGMGCGFCNTQPWWFGSRQVGPFRWLLCNGYCTVSPDHGWARPYKVPVRRMPIGYTRFYGDTGSGAAANGSSAPANYPIIYTATDTTQLGYTYQHVPQWRDQPHLYPPTPWPGNFHYRYCPQGQNCGTTGFGMNHQIETIEPVEGQPSVTPDSPAAKTAGNAIQSF